MPQRVGRYELLRPLGQGGMGAVWEARDPALPERRLALKRLHPELCDPGTIERFLREAELLARVRHPGVVVVHAVERDPQGPYLVTDLVEGRSLEEVVAGGGLPPARAALVVERLCQAVEALHRAGLVHRDLKPANVLLRPDGAPVLLDFGLTRELDREGLTRTGELLGTPAYMAPEQARDARRVDARADVYGLGAILYALLRGAPPFQGSLFQVLEQVLTRGPAWPASEEDPALDAVCRRAMARDPEDRFAGAAALGEALRDPRGAAGSAPRAGRAAGLAVAGLALAAVMLGGALLWPAGAGPPAPAPVQPLPPVEARPSPGPSPQAASPEEPARPKLPSLSPAEVTRLVCENELAARLRGLKAIRVALEAGEPEERWLSEEVKQRLYTGPLILGALGLGRVELAFVPDEWTLLLLERRGLHRWDLVSPPRRLWALNEPLEQLRPLLGTLRREEDVLALVGDGSRALGLDPREAGSVPAWEQAVPGKEHLRALRADPQGRRAFLATPTEWWLIPGPRDPDWKRVRLAFLEGAPLAAAWAPGGERLAVLAAQEEQEGRVVSARVVTFDRQGQRGEAWSLEWPPLPHLAVDDAGRVFFASADGERLFLGAPGARERIPLPPKQRLNAFTLAPDGARLWLATTTPGSPWGFMLWLDPAAAQPQPEMWRLLASGDPISLAVSSDGALLALAFSDGRVWVGARAGR